MNRREYAARASESVCDINQTCINDVDLEIHGISMRCFNVFNGIAH